MKIKPLKITFESLDEFIAKSKIAISEAIKTKRKSTQKKDTQIWSSVEAYQQFMSDQKYAILATIYKYHPQSVYQLAKLLKRAQQNVARDCDLLEGHGFIKFENPKTSRNSKSPKLSFDYNAIIIHPPTVTYKVEFEEAA